MECMFTGKRCFLAGDEWRAAARKQHECIPERLHNFLDDFSGYLAELPELLRDGFDLREAQKMGKKAPFSLGEISVLMSQTLDLYGRMRLWGEQLRTLLPFPEEKPSSTNDTLFPVVFHYTNLSGATIYCAYWACIIILQEILKSCGCVPDDALDGNEMVSNICKSVEYNSMGTWGGFRMGFPLRIAWELAAPVVKLWITRWHEKHAKVYAATSPEGLPQGPFEQRTIREPKFSLPPITRLGDAV